MFAKKPLTSMGHVFYEEGEMDDGVWLNPPVGANYVVITAELIHLYWRNDGILPLPGHRLDASHNIEYHGSNLNFVTLRGSGRAAVTFYRM
jgi:hypothetical protein